MKTRKLAPAVPVLTTLVMAAITVGLLFQLGILGSGAASTAALTVPTPTATTAAPEVAAPKTAVPIVAKVTASPTALDAYVGSVVASIKLPAEDPQGIFYSKGSLWAVCVKDRLLVKIDPKTDQIISTVQLPNEPAGVAATDSAIWISTSTGTYVHVDPGTDKVVGSFAVGNYTSGGMEEALTLADGSLWIANGKASTVIRVDPASGAILATIPMHDISLKEKSPLGWPASVAGKNELWVTDGHQQSVVGIDLKTNAVIDTIPIGLSGDGLSLVGDTLWINDSEENKVVRLELASKKIVASFDVDFPVGTVATQDQVWVSLPYIGHMMRIDPRINSVVGLLTTFGTPQGAVAAEGAIWLADISSGRIVKIIPTP